MGGAQGKTSKEVMIDSSAWAAAWYLSMRYAFMLCVCICVCMSVRAAYMCMNVRTIRVHTRIVAIHCSFFILVYGFACFDSVFNRMFLHLAILC